MSGVASCLILCRKYADLTAIDDSTLSLLVQSVHTHVLCVCTDCSSSDNVDSWCMSLEFGLVFYG